MTLDFGFLIVGLDLDLGVIFFVVWAGLGRGLHFWCVSSYAERHTSMWDKILTMACLSRIESNFQEWSFSSEVEVQYS